MCDASRGTSEPCNKPRPWYRLHVSTGCLLFPAAAVLLLVLLPGDWADTVQLNVGAWWGSERTFEHGWPWVYLKRSVVFQSGSEPEYPQSGIPWLFQSAWGFQGDRREFRPSILAIDVLAGLCLLALVAAAVEWRRRRHRRFWQFGVGGLLALICLVAAVLGWYQYNRLVYQRETKLASLPERVWGAHWSGVTIEYRGPLWLRRLAGQHNLQGLHRVTAVSLVGQQFGDEELERRVEDFKTLLSLESLTIATPHVTNAGLACLVGLPRLRSLELAVPSVTDAGLECVAKLPQLRSLGVSSQLVTDAGLVHVERLGNLRELSLASTSIGSTGLKHLRGLNQLEMLCLSNTRIDDAGLVHLSGLANLRELDLTSTDVEGRGLLHLQNLKNLEFVGMVGTPVKIEYVEEFSESLPNCYVATRTL